jgi:hypothetical protein
VATLENSTLRVIVVPELNGRIISILDKATSTDFVHHPDPGERGYPDLNGLGAFVYADYFTRDPYEAVWELQAQPGQQEVHLTGTCPNGLKMQRTIRLLTDKALVHTEITVQNSGHSAAPAVLNSTCFFSPKHLEDSAIVFRSQSGKTVQRTVLAPGEQPDASQWYADSDQPDGEWTLTEVGTRMAVANSFPKDQVAQCLVNWSRRKDSRVIMTLWSAKRTLARGETLELEADYEIRKS